ncbi:DUF2889 domain-containing protein [Novosphingobium endophyticum]|nr:DUF2889 domain-containing protein [Novosphingobium endophyticum]
MSPDQKARSSMGECQKQDIAAMPGYRRVLRVEPGYGTVMAMLEDDLHCMAVRLRHDGERVVAVEPLTDRAPWNICPNAQAVLVGTFTGVALSEVTARRDKKLNCTHLHDLAVLAAAHAQDSRPLEYRVYVSDPDGAKRILEIRRNGRTLHRWVERDGVLASPGDVSGLTLVTLRDWIASLEGEEQEAARLLQWASLVAHGRTMTREQRRAAVGVLPSCYAFQPERAGDVDFWREPQDFSGDERQPLQGIRDSFSAVHGQSGG